METTVSWACGADVQDFCLYFTDFPSVWKCLGTFPHQGFPGGSVVKNLSEMQETQVWSLGQEDPLEKEMATHSGIFAWEIPWTKEPGGLQVHGVTKSDIS